MLFEASQIGHLFRVVGIVDTPFLTVLKTWTSTLEHSVIILVCVCLEFPKVLATRLALGSLGSTVLCLILHQTLVLCL